MTNSSNNNSNGIRNEPIEVWFLTSIISGENVKKKVPYYSHLRHRTFGFYWRYEDALEAVRVNRCNMQECLYSYLVVERIREGVPGELREEKWFKWNEHRRKWVSGKKPGEYRHLSGWALG
jgi:hypothetical protein